MEIRKAMNEDVRTLGTEKARGDQQVVDRRYNQARQRPRLTGRSLKQGQSKIERNRGKEGPRSKTARKRSKMPKRGPETRNEEQSI